MAASVKTLIVKDPDGQNPFGSAAFDTIVNAAITALGAVTVDFVEIDQSEDRGDYYNVTILYH